MSSLTQFSFLHVADLGGQRIEQGQKKGSRESRLKQSPSDLPVQHPSGRLVSRCFCGLRREFDSDSAKPGPQYSGITREETRN